MKNDGQPAGAPSGVGRETPLPISERRLKANRENAKKSTGPRTVLGKAYSRANAVKHGLFARDLFPELELPTESREQFQDLHRQLRQEYQPVGSLEAMEVERIAICWWRLRRVRLYENAEITSGVLDACQAGYRDPHKATLETNAIVISLLEDAKKEIETSGEISQELNERIGAADPRFRGMLGPLMERAATQARIAAKMESKEPSPTEFNRVIAAITIWVARTYLQDYMTSFFGSCEKVMCERKAIPDRDALDKIIRCEAAAERSLSRALDRLERLQRRRIEKPCVSAFDVNLGGR